MSKKINLQLDAPCIGSKDKRYLNMALESGYVSTVGPYVREFEEKFSKYLGIENAVSTQSGTAALHISLYELNIGKNDEVIVPALTFVATVNPVKYVGATAVFADIDINTWNIHPEQIRKLITKRTKAIIPTHLYGNPADMQEIMSIAREYKLYVIEDAAESLGAYYKNRLTGTWGTLGIFSFNGNKIITTGGGGMVVGKDKKRIKHIKYLVNQARDAHKEGYHHSELGFNYRMTNIEAALGISQLSNLERFLAKKKRIYKLYQKELSKIKFIKFQEEYEAAESSRWFSCITFTKNIDIGFLQRKLKIKGIPTRRVFTPLVEQGPYKKPHPKKYSNSYYIFKNSLCLPSSVINSEDDISYAAREIKNILCA